MITKFSFNGKATPAQTTLVKDNDFIMEDLVCDAIKAAIQPFYQLNDIYTERLTAIEGTMHAFDQAMGRELRRLQAMVGVTPVNTEHSFKDVCRKIDTLRQTVSEMKREVNSLAQYKQSNHTKLQKQLDKLETLIMHVPGLKDSIEAQETKIKVEAEAQAKQEKEAALAIRIDDIELTARSHNALRNAGIKCVRDLVVKTPFELLRIQNFGGKSLREIEEMLATLGLKLGALM